MLVPGCRPHSDAKHAPMLVEWLEHLITSCPPEIRGFGLLREQIGLDARARRQRTGWAPHLHASRTAILHAAARCQQRDLAVILGAGTGNDVPITDLARDFRRVVLVDVFWRPRVQRRWQALANVTCLAVDLSGALVRLWRDGRQCDDAAVLACFAAATPPQLPGPADLMVSVNLASQLALAPATWLARRGPRGPEFVDACERVACHRHVSWFLAQPGVRCLIADQARLALHPDGSLAEREDLMADLFLGDPDQTWSWALAPIPEWDANLHLHHEVGCWIRG